MQNVLGPWLQILFVSAFTLPDANSTPVPEIGDKMSSADVKLQYESNSSSPHGMVNMMHISKNFTQNKETVESSSHKELAHFLNGFNFISKQDRDNMKYQKSCLNQENCENLVLGDLLNILEMGYGRKFIEDVRIRIYDILGNSENEILTEQFPVDGNLEKVRNILETLFGMLITEDGVRRDIEFPKIRNMTTPSNVAGSRQQKRSLLDLSVPSALIVPTLGVGAFLLSSFVLPRSMPNVFEFPTADEIIELAIGHSNSDANLSRRWERSIGDRRRKSTKEKLLYHSHDSKLRPLDFTYTRNPSYFKPIPVKNFPDVIKHKSHSKFPFSSKSRKHPKKKSPGYRIMHYSVRYPTHSIEICDDYSYHSNHKNKHYKKRRTDSRKTDSSLDSDYYDYNTDEKSHEYMDIDNMRGAQRPRRNSKTRHQDYHTDRPIRYNKHDSRRQREKSRRSNFSTRKQLSDEEYDSYRRPEYSSSRYDDSRIRTSAEIHDYADSNHSPSNPVQHKPDQLRSLLNRYSTKILDATKKILMPAPDTFKAPGSVRRPPDSSFNAHNYRRNIGRRGNTREKSSPGEHMWQSSSIHSDNNDDINLELYPRLRMEIKF